MKGILARKGLFASIAAAVAIGLALLVPVAVSAHQILSGPTLSGVPQEGETVTAKAEWKGVITATTWKWQRCTAGNDPKCNAIKGAALPTYVLTAADVGFVIRVRLTLTASHGDVSKRSGPTPIVQPKSAPPPPVNETPEPEPDPEDITDDPADERFDPPAAPVLGDPPAIADELHVMDPFPVVRISGRLTGSGADVKRLSVRAPRGATISVRCRGGSCPARMFTRAARVKRLSSYERHLRAGTKLDIVVRKPNRIGKWTTITIRRGAPPKRVDRCSYPGRGHPAACPAA